jgi:hypothetical protein
MDRTSGSKTSRPTSLRCCGAFTYIVTWACDAAEFRKKADTIVATLDLYVAGIEGEEPLAQWIEKRSPSDEVEDMIQRAEVNRNAIVWEPSIDIALMKPKLEYRPLPLETASAPHFPPDKRTSIRGLNGRTGDILDSPLHNF